MTDRNSQWPFVRTDENPFQQRTNAGPIDLTSRPSRRQDNGMEVFPGDVPGGLLPEGARGFGSLGRQPRGRFIAYPFQAGVAELQLIPQQSTRAYLILINNSAAARIFVGFDYVPNAVNGVILEINLGFYEPWVVPTNGVIVTAAANNTPGIALVCIEE